MTLGEQYFLEVVERKSISRAAEALYVSQQSISNQIARMEKSYGMLFLRKPRFSLTPTGEVLFDSLCKMRILEKETALRLAGLQNDSTGIIRLGLHTARARVLFPSLMQQMRQKYPGVRIEVLHADTRDYESLLEKGSLDLFLGIDPRPRREFDYLPLPQEPVFLMASPVLLAQCGCAQTGALQPADLKRLPLIFSPESSHLQTKISNFLAQSGIPILPQIVIGDFAVQLSLARNHLGACFCPQMFLSDPVSEASVAPALQKCSISGFSPKNRLALVTSRGVWHPGYFHDFTALLQAGVQNSLKIETS